MDKRIVVSATSYPARLWSVPRMLESIYAQTLQPDQIVLYLSLEQFPKMMSDVAEISPELVALAEKGKLNICFKQGDLKPHKKYIYAFQDFPHDLIIVVDEDLIFPADMIQTLYESWQKYPHCTHATRTHLMVLDETEILPYYEWIWEVDVDLGEPQFQVYATTGAGTLYDPSLFKKYLYDEEAIKATCLHADDMWMKANELISGIPVVTTRRYTALNYIPGTQTEGTLFKFNTPEIQINHWRNISDWIDKKTGEKDILYNILTHPTCGYSMTDLRQYLQYYKTQRNRDLAVIKSLITECNSLKTERDRISADYNGALYTVSFKVGHFLTAPFRSIRWFLRKIKSV